jgi:hypothetical protein
MLIRVFVAAAVFGLASSALAADVNTNWPGYQEAD